MSVKLFVIAFVFNPGFDFIDLWFETIYYFVILSNLTV